MRFKTGTPVILLAVTLLVSAVFLYQGYNDFRIAENFRGLPLSFDPYTSTSSYDWNGTSVQIQGGFVKALIREKDQSESLLLRSLSPTPKIILKSGSPASKTYLLRLENVNPARTIVQPGTFQAADPHSILLSVSLNPGEERTIQVQPKDDKNYLDMVILGDNRNGYKTFSQIISQINAVAPVFVIDNGDLVFGGEPNRYRLFYETVSQLQVPLYTTLGNHDIRKNGRVIYTELFGPPYYSFDYRDTHFVFLDSSRGWTEKRAIPPEQYRWLEQDLQKAQGKRIYVISHIPPTDPRSAQQPNTLPNIPGVEKTDYFEALMDNYGLYKNLNHAFPDKAEAQKFETLMSKNQVDTVFLSHIHSYFSFIKNGVRYVISGGGGAELLTDNSYYHYLRVEAASGKNYLEVVQLPSPPNRLQDRYIAAAQMFASSIYKEYTTTVIALGTIAALLLVWILWATRHKWWPGLRFLGIWLYEVGKFAAARFKQLRHK